MVRRKFNVGDKVIGNDKKASFRERKGTIVKYELGSQYWVMFDDGRKECVYSQWLDKEPQDHHNLPPKNQSSINVLLRRL